MNPNTLSRAKNYFSTYVILVGDRIANKRKQTLFLLALLVLVGILYSASFALLAISVQALFTQKPNLTLSLMGISISLPAWQCFNIAIGSALLTLFTKFLVTQKMLRMSLDWQASLIWRAMNQLSRLANFEKIRAPLPGSVSAMAGYLTRKARAAYLIERLLSIGIQQIVIILLSGLVVAWIDWGTAALSIAVGILFLPLYAQVLQRMIGIRKKLRLQMPARRANLRALLTDGFLSSEQNRVEFAQLKPEERHYFSATYGTISHQILWLNGIHFLAGLHLFTTVFVIWYFRWETILRLDDLQLMHAAALLLLMRSILSLINLMGNLTRNYGDLALLRDYFFPAKKTSRRNKRNKSSINLCVVDPAEKTISLNFGDHAFIRGVKIRHSYQLIFLSNAIQTKNIPAHFLRHLILISKTNLHWLRDNIKIMGTTGLPKFISDDRQLDISFTCDDQQPENYPAIVIPQRFWDRLTKSPKYADLRRSHIWFVLVEEDKIVDMDDLSSTPAILSDGDKVLRVGTFGTISKIPLAQSETGARPTEDGQDDIDDDEI